jgi:hypothetical protein
MLLGAPFIAPRQLGAVGGILGRPKLPSVGWRTGQSGVPPDSYCSCLVPDSLPNRAQQTVADLWQLAHRTLSGAHRTVRCPLATVGAGHASPAYLVADRYAGGRWLTGQSGAPLDSPVNYSRTPLKFSREWPVRWSWPGAPDTVRCTTGQSGVPDRAESWLLQPSPFLFLFSLILALRQTSLVPKTNELSLETYLLVDLYFIHHMAYNNPLNMCWTLNHQNTREMAQGHISLSATPTEAESVEAKTAEDVNLEATLSEIDTMLLDAAAEEAAAAAEEIPGTVAGKGKEKAEDTSEEEDFNFQDILGQELSKAEKEELKEYAISCGYRPGALLFGGVNEESLGCLRDHTGAKVVGTLSKSVGLPKVEADLSRYRRQHIAGSLFYANFKVKFLTFYCFDMKIVF